MTSTVYQRLLAQPTLIAHRGYQRVYPENTVLSLEQAFVAGACCVEFDVQLSRDLVPVVIHDNTLARTGDGNGNVFELSGAELQQRGAGEPQRFGKRYADVRIPLLADVLALLQRWPERLAMVEIKRASLKQFGVTECLSRIVEVLEPVLDRCVFISFNVEVLVEAKARGLAIGFVFDEWTEGALKTARHMRPPFLIVDAEVVPVNADLLASPWRWMVYAVDETAAAINWASRGVELVETNNIGGLLGDNRLLSWGCAKHAL